MASTGFIGPDIYSPNAQAPILRDERARAEHTALFTVRSGIRLWL
jgi:hypothetical protein